ncbi:MAG: nucleotidyltransferase domain-containing protein [Bacteroidota bacterium]
MTTKEVVETLKSHKQKFEDKFNAKIIALFGSYARNEQKTESDIDILYQPLDKQNFGLKEIVNLEDYIKKLFKVDKVDLVDKDYINPIIELEIQDDIVYV